jgi:vacuolar-type H+-ATPase subunit C/Vma6
MKDFKILALGLPVRLSAKEADSLYKELEAKDKHISELEKDKAFLLTQRFMGNTIISNEQGLSDAISAHNLEQQAIGVDIVYSHLNETNSEIDHIRYSVKFLANEMREKLKAVQSNN